MEPKLRVRASGYGGSGYKHPHTGLIVPGVTTVLKNLNKPAIVQWAVDNTAAYAVANIDGLLNRTQEQGYGFLRWYWKRDPLKGDLSDIRNYSNGVLDDSAELGTLVHDWIAADHGACPYPDVSNAPAFFWEMVEQWDGYKTLHEIEPIHSEVTLWNDEYGYAGTADGIWKIDGKLTLVDIKTSRNTWDEHWMQIVALAACDTMLLEVDGEWVEEGVPEFDQRALLHIRPSDTDKSGNPMFPFAELKVLDGAEDIHLWTMFRGLLDVGHAMDDLQTLRKRRKNE
jgi:hypothetical protein